MSKRAYMHDTHSYVEWSVKTTSRENPACSPGTEQFERVFRVHDAAESLELGYVDHGRPPTSSPALGVAECILGMLTQDPRGHVHGLGAPIRERWVVVGPLLGENVQIMTDLVRDGQIQERKRCELERKHRRICVYSSSAPLET